MIVEEKNVDDYHTQDLSFNIHLKEVSSIWLRIYLQNWFCDLFHICLTAPLVTPFEIFLW